MKMSRLYLERMLHKIPIKENTFILNFIINLNNNFRSGESGGDSDEVICVESD